MRGDPLPDKAAWKSFVPFDVMTLPIQNSLAEP